MSISSSLASQIPDLNIPGSGPWKLAEIGLAFLAITWITFVLRVWTRAVIMPSLGWDDYTMFLTMAAFTVQCGYPVKAGLAKYPYAKEEVTEAAAELITDIITFAAAYIVAATFLKISLALFFLRIVLQPWERRVIVVSLVIYTTYATTYWGIATFGCGAPSKYLLHTLEGKCISVSRIVIPMTYVQTSLNAVIDWIFVILPIRSLWNLRLPRPTKLVAGTLILLGALGSVASLVRLGSVDGFEPGRDFPRRSITPTIWATIEMGLGISAVNLATTRPMFRRFIERTNLHTTKSQGDKSRRPSPVHMPTLELVMTPGLATERADSHILGSSDFDGELAHIQQDPEKGITLELHP